MQKIPTLFVRDPQDRRFVTDAVNPGCEWVVAGEGQALRQYDGTCVMLDDDGAWWARREVKPGKNPPTAYVPVATDPATGKTVGWEPIGQFSFAKYHAEALHMAHCRDERLRPGTFELCGPKINGNPENWDRHTLIAHRDAAVVGMPRQITYASLRHLFLTMLGPLGYEGVVWHHPGGQLAKLKVRDFRRTEVA